LARPTKCQGRDTSTDGDVQISRWRGLPLQDGRNVFLADIYNQDGTKAETLREEIWYVKDIAINLEPPYRLLDEGGDNRLREQTQELAAPLSNRREFAVGADGILRVELEPTLRTGKVTVIATFQFICT